MRKLYWILLLTSCWQMPAFAEKISATSKIDHVTVFPQGAEVTRIAAVELKAGEHRIVISDLPASVDPRSIRVQGSGLKGVAIAAVDTRILPVDPAANADVAKTTQDKITALSIARADIDKMLADSIHQRQFLLSLADKQLTPQTSVENTQKIDVSALTNLLDLVEQRLLKLALHIQSLEAKQRDIDLQIQNLNIQLTTLAPAHQQQLEAAIEVDAETDVTGQIMVSYRLEEAGWLPYYDADLTVLPKSFSGKVDLVRRAEVTQWSGETWDAVELTLSTTRPTGTTAAPDLNEEELQAFDERLRKEDAKVLNLAPAAPMIAEEGLVSQDAAEAEKKNKIELVDQRQAQIELAGFQANYNIQGRVTVDNAGTAKKVRIASSTQTAELSLEAVPMLDLSAYLTASFKLSGEGPLLPGHVNLFREGTFLGQGNLPLLNPDEEAKLGFGADDLVKIERKQVHKSVGEQGYISTSNVEEKQWDITVKNLHDVAVKLNVLDRVPFSANNDIEITRMPGMTEPTRINDQKRRGVMAYDLDMAAQTETVLKMGYSITWPENMRIGSSQ